MAELDELDAQPEPLPDLDTFPDAPPAPAVPAEPSAPSEAPPLPEGADESEDGLTLGSTPRGRAANAAMLALARAARSFNLYDAQNEAIRKFLVVLQQKTREALDGFGALRLSVRPFELISEGEPVYLERDREKSLAFRLYRDGVRRLEIDPRVGWDELLRLLEILSVRTAGTAGVEEDTVTLLRKTRFYNLRFSVVDGFLPDEEFPEDVAREEVKGRRVLDRAVMPPDDWDLPLPPLDAPVGVVFRAPPATVRAAIAREVAPDTLADAGMRLATGLLRAIEDPTDPASVEELLPYLLELRDYLLITEDLDQLGHMAAMLHRSIVNTVDDQPLHAAVFKQPDVIRQAMAVAALRGGDNALEEHLFAPHPTISVPVALSMLADRLERGAGPKDTPVLALVELLRRYAREAPELVLEVLNSGSPAVIVALLPVLEQSLPEHRAPVALSLANHADKDVQREALRLLETLPLGPALVPTLQPLLRSRNPEVRTRAASLVGRIGDDTIFRSLVQQIEARAGHDLGADEAVAMGEAMARMAPSASQAKFVEWIRPKGWLARFMDTASRREKLWVAAGGLGLLPGDEPEQLLKAIAGYGDDELRTFAISVASRRRRGARHG